VNSALALTSPHRSKQISDTVAGDPDVVDLTVGEPSFGPPARLLDALAELTAQRPEEPSASYNRYAHSRGTPDLRSAISGWYERAYGLAVDPETRVLVTHGAAEALWTVVFALTDPGDEVILPDPCYMLYEPIVVALGRTPVRVAAAAEDGFTIDPDAVARAAGPRTRLVLVNSPANPTGAVCEPDRLAALIAVAAGRGLYLVHDEVFDCFSYVCPHLPAIALPGGAESAIVVNSLSKRFGMTGWRIGWLAGPESVVAAAAKAHSFVTLAVGTLIQQVAAVALADASVDDEVARHAHLIRDRGRDLLDRLLALDLFECTVPPGGGFYLFLRCARLAGRIGVPESESASEAVAGHLLEHARVASVPGIAFGPRGEGFVRFSYAAPEAAVDRAARRLEALGAAMTQAVP
jgi:aminotransferase